MAKQKTQDRPKTSKSPKLKVTDETQCVLVTIEQGRFCEHGINGKHSNEAIMKHQHIINALNELY